MDSSPEPVGRPLKGGAIPLDELARRKGVQAVEVDDTARDARAWSDEALDTFLAHVGMARHTDLA